MYQKSQSYDVRFLRYRVRQTDFFVTFRPFFPFYHPPNDPENDNFEKKRKKCLEILSFYIYMCTINEDHMIYGSWSKVQQPENFVILGCFLPFLPPDNPENQNFKIEKKHHWHIIILQICTINDILVYICTTWYIVPEIWSATDRIFCHSGPFFAHLPPYGPRKSKFFKNEKKHLQILSFYKCVP